MKTLRAWLAFGLLAAVVAAARAQPAAAADADWRYRVIRGDTLITLTEAWLAPPRTWRELQKLNRVDDPLRLMPGSTLRMPVAWLRREAAVAEVVFVKGGVTLQRGGGREALAAGASLRSGDALRTGAQSSVSLRFADGSRLLVPPDSEVTLVQLLVLGRGALPAVRVDLVRGGVDNSVAPNAQHVPMYELRTPHVNLGVRGTEFRVQVAGAATRMQVLRGAVHADGLAADVSGGQGLLAEGGARSVGPLLPAPQLAGSAGAADRLPLRLTWPASPPGAVAWRAQLFPKGDFDRLLLDARVDEPAVAWPQARELADGDYTLRLRGIDARGHEGAAADADVHLQARPEPPFMQAPPPEAVSYSGGMAFAWTRNTAAPDVRLQIARDPAFQDLVLQPPPIAAAGFEARLPDGGYHWRIAAVDASGRAGPFGDAQRFEIRPPPPAPPPAESEVSGEQLRLRWQGGTGAARYQLEWSVAPAFEGAEVRRFDTGRPELALPRPAPGTYFLRARAINAAGVPGPWGQTQRIEQPYPRWVWLLPLALIPLF
ncbi:FecR domain-containing protein [Pelomonas sp. P7]|uniref:FecR domain-containing protein n=1 Tax=Pelomonas caseinilytica TaxID=2906763 RepID=A0ABS8XLH3_9BURK|nr:FecR domain-containing protein [Pelomonas sp. P7]MCE4539503.1 FecR domain-containing protein [Pelomonas sp. P7]